MGTGNGGRVDDRALRRHAIQIAAQLPECERDALQVLRYAMELANGFLEGREPKAEVIAYPRPGPIGPGS
jgi:hypothetical protein